MITFQQRFEIVIFKPKTDYAKNIRKTDFAQILGSTLFEKSPMNMAFINDGGTGIKSDYPISFVPNSFYRDSIVF